MKQKKLEPLAACACGHTFLIHHNDSLINLPTSLFYRLREKHKKASTNMKQREAFYREYLTTLVGEGKCGMCMCEKFKLDNLKYIKRFGVK